MNQNHAPASWRVRVAAYLIDSAIPFVGAALFAFSALATLAFSLSVGLGHATPPAVWLRFLLLTGALAGIVAFIGYFVWWIISLKHGRTPGKKIVKIRVVNAYTGETPRRRTMFAREILAKFLQFSVAASMVFDALNPLNSPLFLLGISLLPLVAALAIAQAVNLLWPLWDGDSQALHDKVFRTRVIYD